MKSLDGSDIKTSAEIGEKELSISLMVGVLSGFDLIFRLSRKRGMVKRKEQMLGGGK